MRFWGDRLEQYSWRAQERDLNDRFPQFRTAVKIKDSTTPLRVHFLHIRSEDRGAVPLLLVPTFPLTNLSLGRVVEGLRDGEGEGQKFHIVVPSIPGLGFSDAFSESDGGVLERTAEVFDILMQRLGYEYYIASATGSGVDSPAGIDYHLARLVGEKFPERCLGVHLLGPLVQRPTYKEPWVWVRYGIARFFHAGIWGYVGEDWVALRESERLEREGKKRKVEGKPRSERRFGSGYGAVGILGLREPNTLAYGLCDSPVGLLSLVCSALRRMSPDHKLSSTEIIDFTQLAWLPGPEAGMRFWSESVSEVERMKKLKKSRVAVTVFGTDEEGYQCPAWSDSNHDVIFSQRLSGKAGLVAWERANVVVAGIRGLAKELERIDGRLKAKSLEEVVIDETIHEVDEEASMSDHGMQLDVESPDTVVAVEMS